jgi:hypothetical protein
MQLSTYSWQKWPEVMRQAKVTFKMKDLHLLLFILNNAKTATKSPNTLLLYKLQPSLQPPGLGGMVGITVALMLLLCRWQMKAFG